MTWSLVGLLTLLLVALVFMVYSQRQDGFTKPQLGILHATDGTALSIKLGLGGAAPTYTPTAAAAPPQDARQILRPQPARPERG